MIGTYIARAIKVSVATKLDYERMSNNQINFLPKLMISDSSLTVNLLNIGLIRMHILDVLCDQYLVESNFLCLTETQLQKHDDLDQTNSIVNGKFKVKCDTNEGKCRSIAICYKDNISILNYVKLNGVSVIQFQKSTFSDQPINLAVVSGHLVYLEVTLLTI